MWSPVSERFGSVCSAFSRGADGSAVWGIWEMGVGL